jgi:transmembrane sensor
MADNTDEQLHAERIRYLFEGYMNGRCTPEEETELAVLALAPENQLVFAQLEQEYWEKETGGEWTSDEAEKYLKQILTPPQKKIRSISRWWMAAASVILLLAVGAYLYYKPLGSNDKTATATQPVPSKNDVAPGREGAILTLTDGTVLVLDSFGNGVIPEQSGTRVKLQNAQLVYEASGKPTGDVGYNTMTTPKGRQFQLVLPDGTKVWLNAASSITYPTVFIGAERNVSITGEAYFEVTRNKSRPFRVKINDAAEVEVLGTSFNVNAYLNEGSIKTTLLEGAVRVNAYKQLQTLTPGQQAQIKANEKIKLVNEADIEKAVAWKNGYFNFNDADLYEVMRQLERWYDIDVVYAKPVGAIEFNGALPKNLSLSEILEILAKMQIKYKIEEGRKLVIEP